MTIDIRSLAFSIGIAALVQIAALFLQFRLNKNYRGTGWWLLWGLCMAAGFMALLSRDFVPSWLAPLTILTANALLIMGLVFLYVGVIRFTERKENLTLAGIAFAAFLLVTIYAIFIVQHENIRVVALYLSVVLFCFLSARGLFLYRTADYGTSAAFTAAVLLAEGAYFLIRSIAAVIDVPVDPVFTPTPWQAVTTLLAALAGLLTTFGLVIMVGQRSNSEMRRSREEFELIFNTGPRASVITRLQDDVIIHTNQRFDELTGFSRTETEGRAILELGLWQNHADYHNLHKELAKKELVGYFMAPLTARDGRRIDCILSARAVTIGGLPHAISIIYDVTERRRQDEDRQRIERLEALGQMAGGIAGEFEGLFSEALGIITLAGIEARHGSTLKGHLEKAEKALLNASQKLRQLQLFSRSEPPSRSSTNIGEVLRDTVSFVLRGSDTVCRLTLPTDLWPAVIDRGQISQVINHLASRARQAMSGRGTIEVTATNLTVTSNWVNPSLPGGTYLKISIIDHGPGLSREQLDRIFDPFSAAAEGGLGLAACFAIMRNHGGYLEAESGTGGTIFNLYLPARQTGPDAEEGGRDLRP